MCFPGHRCLYGTALRMSQYDHQLHVQMFARIFDTAKLCFLHYIAGNTDRKQFPDPAQENCFRDLTGIRTRNNDSIWMLALFSRFHAAAAGGVAERSFLNHKCFIASFQPL